MTNDLAEHIKSLDIQEIRLSNGDHIIAEVVYDDANAEFVIKDPVEITVIDNVMQFTEYFPYCQDQYFVIERENIIACGKVNFPTKAIFVRSVLVRTVKKAVMYGGKSNPEDIGTISQLNSLISGKPQEETVSSDQYQSWDELIDSNSTIH